MLRWLNFEFSSVCNMRCKWCSLDHSKEAVFLEPALLEKGLKEMAGWGTAARGIQQVDFHNGGETLLHPQLDSMLVLIARYRPQIAAQKFFLLTNGFALNGIRAERLANCTGLDRVRVSIDGGSKSLYEEIRGPHFETVKRNFADFVELVKHAESAMETEVICIVPPDKPLSQEWMGEEFLEVIRLADKVSLRHPHGWVGDCSIPVDANMKKPERMCKFLMHNMVVMASGEVTICCADLNGKGIIGDLGTSSLKDIWYGEARMEKMLKWRQGDFQAIEPCVTCEGYYEAR